MGTMLEQLPEDVRSELDTIRSVVDQWIFSRKAQVAQMPVEAARRSDQRGEAV